MLSSIPKKQRSAKSTQLRVIEIGLFPPTERHYPRFDYEEIRRELGLDDETGREGVNVEDQDGFRDRDAEELVRRLEAKYGTQTVGPSSTKKVNKKSKKALKFAPEDLMDKGLGYDLEDEFIDDTQAYDEWVPTSMDTAKRGHYVNKGPLEFRQVDLDATSESSSDDGDTQSSGGASSMSEEENEDMDVEEIDTDVPAVKAKDEQKTTGGSSSQQGVVGVAKPAQQENVSTVAVGGHEDIQVVQVIDGTAAPKAAKRRPSASGGSRPKNPPTMVMISPQSAAPKPFSIAELNNGNGTWKNS